MSWQTLTVEEWLPYVEGTYDCKICGTMPIVCGEQLHKKCHVCHASLRGCQEEIKGRCYRHMYTHVQGEHGDDSSFESYKEVE